MVEASEIVKLQQNEQDINDFKLATVTALNENGTALIQFFGEEESSQKTFSYLASYKPMVDDTVLMMAMADTYVIFGKVLISSDAPIDLVTQDEMEAAMQNFITSEAVALMLAGYSLSGHTHSNYALTGHTHTIYALTEHNHNGTYAPLNHDHNSLIHATRPSYNAGLNIISDGFPAFVPSHNNTMDLGCATYKWKQLYAGSGTINTSDKRQKKFIRSINDKYTEFFKKIRPVTYKFKKNQSDRIHIGFIAQEIEETLNDVGMNSGDFAGFIKSPIEGKEDFEYGLRYTEFIALNTYMIQQLALKVEALENQLKEGEK